MAIIRNEEVLKATNSKHVGTTTSDADKISSADYRSSSSSSEELHLKKNDKLRVRVICRKLVDGRDKPIITCLEFIREYLMKRIVNVQLVIRKCNGPLTPNAERLFKVILKVVAQIKVDWNEGDLYQATNP
ncbi:hypothetical protein Tco_1555526 [Tanacetum coccineum]